METTGESSLCWRSSERLLSIADLWKICYLHAVLRTSYSLYRSDLIGPSPIEMVASPIEKYPFFAFGEIIPPNYYVAPISPRMHIISTNIEKVPIEIKNEKPTITTTRKTDNFLLQWKKTRKCQQQRHPNQQLEQNNTIPE